MGHLEERVVGDADARASGDRPLWSRLATSPFELGQNDYAAFVGQRRPHGLRLDRVGGPLAIQLGLIVALITVVGGGDAAERSVGLVVAGSAVALGTALVVWRRVLPLLCVDACLLLAGGLIVAAGLRGGELGVAVPALSVAVATALFAQRGRLLSFAFAGLLGLGYAVVLAATDPGPAPVTRWVIVMVAILSSGLFVHWIRWQALDVVDADLAARRRAEAAARELVDLTRVRSEFLARLSHDLRTPLDAILRSTSILQSGEPGPLTATQAEYLEDVRGAGLHLMDLVDEVLDPADADADAPRLVVAPVAIGEVIGDSVRLVRERATRGGVAIRTEVDPRLPIVLADARRIRQVLLNLVANAVRFTPPGGTIVVRGWSTGGRLSVSVSDTGVGIAPEDQQRMFDRFEQLGDATDGTGLGLSLARRFVEQHGGQISVDSDRGRGATFTVWLPVRPVSGPVAVPDPDPLRLPDTPLYSALVEPGSPANRALIARVGRWASLSATGLALVLTLITPGPWAMRAGTLGFAAAALLAMLLMRPYTDRVPVLGLDLIGLLGVLGITVIAFVSGSFSDLAPLGYCWLIMTAFAPWARGSGVFLVACVGVSYAVVLVLHPGPGSELARWLAVVGVLGLNGLTLRSLVQNLRVMLFAERRARLNAEAIEEELATTAAQKDELVGSMSHELRTPLHAVIGFSDVLARGVAGDLNERQRAYVDEVRAAGRRLLGIVDAVLTQAKRAHDGAAAHRPLPATVTSEAVRRPERVG